MRKELFPDEGDLYAFSHYPRNKFKSLLPDPSFYHGNYYQLEFMPTFYAHTISYVDEVPTEAVIIKRTFKKEYVTWGRWFDWGDAESFYVTMIEWKEIT